MCCWWWWWFLTLYIGHVCRSPRLRGSNSRWFSIRSSDHSYNLMKCHAPSLAFVPSPYKHTKIETIRLTGYYNIGILSRRPSRVPTSEARVVFEWEHPYSCPSSIKLGAQFQIWSSSSHRCHHAGPLGRGRDQCYQEEGRMAFELNH